MLKQELIKEHKEKGLHLLREFKKFAVRGNVIDLAIGVIIGGAFGKIVTSVVNDLVMAPLGPLLGRVDFKSLFLSLDGRSYETIEVAKKAGAPVFLIGNFFQQVFEFLIVALVVFLVVRQINKLTVKQEPTPPGPTTKECPQCLLQIPIKAIRCGHCTQPVT